MVETTVGSSAQELRMVHGGTRSLLSLIVAIACGACGEDGSGNGSDPEPSGPPGGAGMGGQQVAVSYAADVQPLFELGCGCHTGPNFMQLGAPFSLEASAAYGNIVSATSQQVPTMLLVSPGSLNDSYLWLKMQGTQAEVGGGGQVMPPGVPLDDAQKDLVARWIAGGALP